MKEVVNEQWFGGQYMDDKPEHYFAQFGTDPQEIIEGVSGIQNTRRSARSLAT